MQKRKRPTSDERCCDVCTIRMTTAYMAAYKCYSIEKRLYNPYNNRRKKTFFFKKKRNFFIFTTKHTSSLSGTFSQTRNHLDKIEKQCSSHRFACRFPCSAVVRKTRFLLSRTLSRIHKNNTRIYKQCRFGLFRFVVEIFYSSHCSQRML